MFKVFLRWTLYAVLAFLFFCIQSALGARFDLVLPLIVCVSIFESRRSALFAAFAGVLYAPRLFYCIFFAALALCVFLLCENYMRRLFVTSLLFSVAGTAACGALRFLLFRSVPLLQFLKLEAVELICAAALTFIPYLIVRTLHKRLS